MREFIYRYLDSDGDGTGTKDMSTTADEYFITDADQRMFITRSLWHITDVGAPTAALFGAATALTNGCLLLLRDEDGATVLDLTDEVPIKANGDLARVCFNVEYSGFGAGAQSITGRWTFEKAGGPLEIPEGWSLVCKTQDTIAPDSMYVMVQGYKG